MTTNLILLNGALFTTALSTLCLGAYLLRKSSRSRSIFVSCALAAVAIWPLVVHLGNAAVGGLVPAPIEQDRWSPTISGPAIEAAEREPGTAAATPHWQQMQANGGIDWTTLVLLAWALGSAVAIGRLVLEDVVGRRLARAITSDPRSREGERANRILAKHGLPFRAIESPTVSAPAALPYQGGFILLPVEGPSLDDDAYEAAVLHEAAHLTASHHRLIWVYGLAVAAAWWNPLVHLASSTAEEALEDLCDDRTSTLQSSTTHLARCLLAFTEWSLRPLQRPALNMIRSRKRLDLRVRRLLKQGVPTMTTNRAAGVSAALLSLGSIAFAASLTASPQSLTGASFGLSTSSAWTYRVTYADGKTEIVKKQAVGKVKVKGREVTELWTTRPSLNKYEYLASEDAGLMRYQGAYNQNFAGVQESFAPTLLLKRDVASGSSWTWSEIPPMQFMGRMPDDMEQFRVTTTARIESMAAQTTTSAGQFNAVVVRYDAVDRKGHHESTTWISPEVGIIKEESPTGQIRKVELLEFRPAGSTPPRRG
jgi:beta-lactamase regulating signal transducer with metallopeptidase domain